MWSATVGKVGKPRTPLEELEHALATIQAAENNALKEVKRIHTQISTIRAEKIYLEKRLSEMKK